MRKFAVIVENAGKNFSAYSPDLPGCVATGRTVEETMNNMVRAIQMQLEGLEADQAKIPASSTVAANLLYYPVESQRVTV